jgi:hypothetical protein
MEAAMDRQGVQQRPDLLIRAAMMAPCQQLSPEVQAEVRRLLKQLLAEFTAAATASQTDE